jgi:NOL1/NOP2/fmu family ribosome biogenesis protein
MKIQFIKSPEKKKIVQQLTEQFGLSELPYLLVESGKEKIRGFSGTMNKEEIEELSEIAPIESIGLYLIRVEHDIRLSFDASHILSNQFNKNIVDISDLDYEEWIRGYDIPLQVPSGTYLIKYKDDFLGCAKSNGEKLINHVPKERRLKTKMPENI